MSCRLVSSRTLLGWFLGTVAVSFLLLWFIAPTLEYFPLLSNDEARILSAARTTATHGRLGSDIYQGAWNTDQNLFLSLPVQRILIAAAFRIAGESITIARAVTLVSALVLLWSLGYFAWRHYGMTAALLAAFLLVAWRSYIGGDEIGMPFIQVARSVRYDLTAVAFIWLALASLAAYLVKPTRRAAVLTGVMAGLATLTQFFGGFVILVILLTLGVAQGKNLWRTRTNAWMVAALLLILIPYALSIAANFDSFITQTLVLKESRTRFTDPLFYAGNFLREGERYERILARAFDPSDLAARAAALLSFLGIGAALLNLFLRLRRKPSPAEWILPLTLIVFGLGLTLIESTKASLYAIVLYPSICLALGVLCNDLLHLRPGLAYRLVGVGVLALFIAAVLVKFNDALIYARDNAALASHYNPTISKILAVVPRNAHILTSARMAWGLQEFLPDTTTYLTMEWRLSRRANHNPALLPALLERHTDYLVLDDAALADFKSEEGLFTQLSDLVAHCAASQQGDLDTTYGIIQIYRITPDAPTCRADKNSSNSP